MTIRSNEIRWDRFPRVQGSAEGRRWLEIQHMLGLASNTIEAYWSCPVSVDGLGLSFSDSPFSSGQ